MRHTPSCKSPPGSPKPALRQLSERSGRRDPWIYQDEEWKAAIEARLGDVEARQSEQGARLEALEETSSFIQKETETLKGDVLRIREEIKRGCLKMDQTSLFIVVIISMVIYIIYINITGA